MYRLATALLCLLLVACSDPAPQEEAASIVRAFQVSIESESARLNAWFDEQFRQELDFNTAWETSRGDKSDYDKLDADALLEFLQPSYQTVRGWLEADRANAPVEQLGARTLPKYTLEAIAYHEDNSGHHMQISIAQAALRGRFGMPAFHDAELGGESLRLPVLEARADRWSEGIR